jgi:hypothetical protein
MTPVYAKIISAIKADSATAAFVGARVYPEGIDMTPESSYPLVTVSEVSEVSSPNPRNERELRYQVDAWSRVSRAEASKIADAVVSALNYKSFRGTGAETWSIRWIRQVSGRDLSEADRKIWRKSMDFSVWARP